MKNSSSLNFFGILRCAKLMKCKALWVKVPNLYYLAKTQVKLLKKTASVKQLYNSVLHAIKTIASSRDDIMPELTKTFFENILRASDDVAYHLQTF